MFHSLVFPMLVRLSQQHGRILDNKTQRYTDLIYLDECFGRTEKLQALDENLQVCYEKSETISFLQLPGQIFQLKWATFANNCLTLCQRSPLECFTPKYHKQKFSKKGSRTLWKVISPKIFGQNIVR